jgi:hypothetical protein
MTIKRRGGQERVLSGATPVIVVSYRLWELTGCFPIHFDLIYSSRSALSGSILAALRAGM